MDGAIRAQESHQRQFGMDGGNWMSFIHQRSDTVDENKVVEPAANQYEYAGKHYIMVSVWDTHEVHFNPVGSIGLQPVL